MAINYTTEPPFFDSPRGTEIGFENLGDSVN